jgi:hypothetical protein
MELPDGNPDAGLGAYGIRLRGLEAASELLVPVAAGAPAVHVEAVVGSAEPAAEYVEERSARIRLRSGGEILIDRDPGRALFRVPHPVRPDELVHPYLAPVAAVVAHWTGRETFHAGAVGIGDGALGVIGEREAGKSSTLAWMALQGVEVLCDDMLVVDGGAALPGPRSIDLREDAAARLGVGAPIGVTGARERWRVTLGPARHGRRISGWIFLAWGESLAARRLSGPERLERLAVQRGLRVAPVRPEVLMTLAALPAWELSRPRGWDSLPGAADLLLELAG